MEVSNWPGPLTVPSLLSRKNPCWVTRFAHPPTHMHASRRTQARTHSCTHACWTFTTRRAPTHAFTHREIYICMDTHTHALYLSEQILASLCGLIVCQVSILHLCITRCCTQSRKAKKKQQSGHLSNPILDQVHVASQMQPNPGWSGYFTDRCPNICHCLFSSP